MFDIILKNGHIWTGTEFLPNADSVAIKDGKIVQIGREFNDAATIFNVNGAIISVGLVDIHIHIKGVSSDSFGIPAESACFPFGVTTAVDASADHQSGNILLNNMWLNTYVFVASSFKNGKLDKEGVEELLEEYGERALGIKLFFDTSNSKIKDISPLLQVCDFARQRNLKVLVHSTGSPIPMSELLDALSEGDICTHIFHGGNNNVSDDIFDCMKKAQAKGVILDNGMAGGVHTDFSIAKAAIAANMLPDTISTDITKLSAFCRGGNYGLTLCMSISRELGMTEEQILKAVTYSAAKAIGKEHCAGALDIGRRADIAVLNYGENPFEIHDIYSNNIARGKKGYTNLLTISRGQIVFRAHHDKIVQENYNKQKKGSNKYE